MKLSFLLGGAAGYVLGARAGHERYEQIVRVSRKFAGSQTVQSTAGVLQAQLDDLAARARGLLGNKPTVTTPSSGLNGTNGYKH
jgi:hypothetical protein